MFAFYADASHSDDLGVTVVSGWLSEKSQWDLFEIDWRLLLSKYSLPYFHMKEFAHFKGPYASWRTEPNKTQGFLQKVVDTIKNRVHRGFTCIVEHANFAAVDVEYQLHEYTGNPYTLAARDCIARANLWLRKAQRGIGVEYIFDEGDQGRGLLVDIIKLHNTQVTGNETISLPVFKPSRDRNDGTKGLTPLQAADFAAYEHMKAWRIGDDAPIWKYRKTIQGLSKIPLWAGKYTEQDLITMCEKAGIPRR